MLEKKRLEFAFLTNKSVKSYASVINNGYDLELYDLGGKHVYKFKIVAEISHVIK